MNTKSLRHASSALAVVCASLSVPAAVAGSPVERAARASGIQQLEEYGNGLALHGTALFHGTEARYELWIHPDGRFRRWIDGPLPMLTVFDGTSLWESDWTRSLRTLELEDADEALAQVALTTGLWSRGDGPLLATGTGDHSVHIRVRDGLYRGTLSLDDDARPALFQREIADGFQIRFEGTIAHGSLTFPRRQERIRADTEPDVVQIERIQALDHAAFAQRQPRPTASDDIRFDVSMPAELEVRKGMLGHLLVPVSINGHEPGWFIFDSGAGGQCVSTSAPWIEDLPSLGRIRVGGVGGHTTQPFRRAKTLQVGPVTMDTPTFIQLDLSFLDGAMGVRVDGILGFDLLARVVADIDLEAGAIELHDPARYQAPVPWQDLILHGRHPCVRARFEGRSATFKLDTGAPSQSVMFHAPYTRKNALLLARDTTDSSSGGVGGLVPTKMGMVTSFQLAGQRETNLPVEFALEDKGAFGDEYTAGNIGGILLKPYRLVLDYSGDRIAFVPRGGL